MLKNNRLIQLLAVIAVFVFMNSCKHKQKTITGNEKPVVKKTTAPTQPETLPPKGNSEGALVMEQKLGLSKKQIHGNKLYSFVNEWYGSPYKYGGCQKSGVDCSCFADLLYESVYGKSLSRTAGEMFEACDKIQMDEAREGDLYFFKINGNKISHVGVCVKKEFFAHSSTSKGVMISSLNEAYYKKYFYCAGRLKKL